MEKAIYETLLLFIEKQPRIQLYRFQWLYFLVVKPVTSSEEQPVSSVKQDKQRSVFQAWFENTEYVLSRTNDTGLLVTFIKKQAKMQEPVMPLHAWMALLLTWLTSSKMNQIERLYLFKIIME